MAELFSDAAFRAVREHPNFQAAVDLLARENVRHHRSLNLQHRWMLRDLGRSSLAGACIILDALPEGLTAERLFESARVNRTCSRNRAVSFLGQLAAWKLLAAPVGEPGWTKVRIVLSPALLPPFAEKAQTSMRAISLIAPELGEAARRVAEPVMLQRFLGAVGLMTASRHDLFAGPDMAIHLFLSRDGGMRILEDLIARQPARRSRLLEGATFTRTALSAPNDISRAQVNRLLADGEAQGLLSLRGDRLEFTPAMSADAERHFALIFELARTSAMAAGLAQAAPSAARA